MCHAPQRCSQRMKDRVRTGDTGAHPFISVTRLIPLSSHALRHSTSRQTPPPKPSSPLRASVATLSFLCMPTFLHESHLFLPPFPAFTPLCLFKSREREEKKDGKWVYVFLGLCCDRIVCPVTQALEDGPAFLCKTRMAWKVMHSKFLFKSPRSPHRCPRCIIVGAAVAKTRGSLSLFHRIATTNNTESLFIHLVNKGDMKAGFNAYERVLVSRSSFTLIHLEVKKKKSRASPPVSKANTFIDLKYGNI